MVEAVACMSMSTAKPKTHVYIDGFNLYYRLRRTPYKWLDLHTMLTRLLPGHDIEIVRYFTARIKPLDDPSAPSRQNAYLRALAASPHLEIHYGQFNRSKVYSRLVVPPPPPASPTVQVWKFEEKGSDVNIAAWMLTEALESRCGCSVLLSNDSDLAIAIELLVSRGHQVGLINPYDDNPNRKLLAQKPHFVRKLRDGLLAASQFPNPVVVDGVDLYRPASW